ncbi:hypothetical protein HY638_00445 [Candidatus Woesearchaeota archaeon]|nr:hypothetical protein [Candidatus Woesearchaeota archaeon]
MLLTKPSEPPNGTRHALKKLADYESINEATPNLLRSIAREMETLGRATVLAAWMRGENSSRRIIYSIEDTAKAYDTYIAHSKKPESHNPVLAHLYLL